LWIWFERRCRRRTGPLAHLFHFHQQHVCRNTGQAYFAEWKKIISFLAQNIPQVAKYQQWNQLRYE